MKTVQTISAFPPDPTRRPRNHRGKMGSSCPARLPRQVALPAVSSEGPVSAGSFAFVGAPDAGLPTKRTEPRQRFGRAVGKKPQLISRSIWGMPGPATPQQADAVMPAWRAFLLPLLSPTGARTRIGTARAALAHFVGPDGAALEGQWLIERRRQFAAKQAEHYAKWIRPLGDKPPHPYVESVWSFAEALRFAKHHWAAGPLLLYASGWLRPFVVTIATADRNRLSRERLLVMLQALPDAIEGDAKARKTWISLGVERNAFQHPREAAGRFLPPKAGPLAIAYALSEHFELDYEEVRHTVWAYLKAWVEHPDWMPWSE